MPPCFEIVALYVSSGHSYFGRHGKPALDIPVTEVDEIECVANRGIVGDRFFSYKSNYRGQVTLFSHEVYDDLSRELGIPDRSTSVFRRNVVTRGVDLNDLIGQEFEIQGVRLMGVEECKPCYWMDQAFGPGAEAALRGRGGLRTRILTSGRIHRSVLANLV